MWWHLGDEDTGRKYPMVLVEQKYGFSRQKIIKRKNIERVSEDYDYVHSLK